MAEYALKLLAKKAGYTLTIWPAVGVGVPGVANNDSGVVMRCVNMEWWDIPFRDEMQKHIPKPVVWATTPTSRACREHLRRERGHGFQRVHHAGHGRRRRADLLSETVERAPQRGRRELGHIIMQDRRHSLHLRQQRLPGALLQRHGADPHRQRGRDKHHESMLWSVSDNNPENSTARTSSRCAMDGDPTALAVFDQYIHNLCLALSSVICLLDPQVIVWAAGCPRTGIPAGRA